jgi:hypothetical protein
LLLLGVFVSHLPFLGPGYGTDTDTWKFATAIREMAGTGHYMASRLPGYPVMEFACTPIARFGPMFTNALSALAAGACAWLAAQLFARHGVRDAVLAGAAFVFLPAAIIAGTSAIDYLWALAFALAAWLEVERGHGARAGLWLGLAIGSRLTSVLFLPSLVVLCLRQPEAFVKRAGLLTGAAVLTAVICYAPVFAVYRWGMFSYYEISGGQSSALHFLSGMLQGGGAGVPWPLIGGQATVLLFGLVGSVVRSRGRSRRWPCSPARPCAGAMGPHRRTRRGSTRAARGHHLPVASA